MGATSIDYAWDMIFWQLNNSKTHMTSAPLSRLALSGGINDSTVQACSWCLCVTVLHMSLTLDPELDFSRRVSR